MAHLVIVSYLVYCWFCNSFSYVVFLRVVVERERSEAPTTLFIHAQNMGELISRGDLVSILVYPYSF